MLLTEVSLVCRVDPDAVWRIWVDVSNWNRWDDSVIWSRLDSPFETGSKGRLKPKGGPECEFELTTVEPNRRFVDVTKLPLASIWFIHNLEPVDGGTRVTHRIEFRGLLGWHFAKLIGRGMKTGLPAAVRALVGAAEGEGVTHA